MEDTSSVVLGLSTIMLSPRTVFNQSVLYPSNSVESVITLLAPRRDSKYFRSLSVIDPKRPLLTLGYRTRVNSTFVEYFAHLQKI